MNLELKFTLGDRKRWRGEPAAEAGMDRVKQTTGMLGTVMNALVMA